MPLFEREILRRGQSCTDVFNWLKTETDEDLQSKYFETLRIEASKYLNRDCVLYIIDFLDDNSKCLLRSTCKSFREIIPIPTFNDLINKFVDILDEIIKENDGFEIMAKNINYNYSVVRSKEKFVITIGWYLDEEDEEEYAPKKLLDIVFQWGKRELSYIKYSEFGNKIGELTDLEIRVLSKIIIDFFVAYRDLFETEDCIKYFLPQDYLCYLKLFLKRKKN